MSCQTTKTRRPGRPPKLPQIERRLGTRIEYYVLREMAHGRTSQQISAALRIHYRSLRRYLRQRGYRIHCSCQLLPIGPLDPGRSLTAGESPPLLAAPAPAPDRMDRGER